MATIDAQGTSLWYETQGEGEPLVLIGGFALLHNQFDFCRDTLIQGGFQTVDWNYRGSGNSSWSLTESPNLERWVEDLRLVLDDANIEKVSIWGTSTSAPIGMRFAAKYPQRTRALVTYPWFRTNDYWRRIFSAALAISEAFGLRQLSRAFAGVVLTADTLYSEEHFRYEKWAAPHYERNVNLATMKSLMDALMMVDLSGDIAKIRCPTLLLMGNESALNSIKGMEAASFGTLVQDFMSLKPDARLEAVPGAGSTYCMITKPQDTAQRVVNFLRSLH